MLSTSGFVDVIFSYHGASGPESSTALHFEEIRQTAVPVGRQTTTVFARVHQNAARTGGEVCCLRLSRFENGICTDRLLI